jgi:hypothetical protein
VLDGDGIVRFVSAGCKVIVAKRCLDDNDTGSLVRARIGQCMASYLVDPASSHMLVSKIKPCMSKHKL